AGSGTSSRVRRLRSLQMKSSSANSVNFLGTLPKTRPSRIPTQKKPTRNDLFMNWWNPRERVPAETVLALLVAAAHEAAEEKKALPTAPEWGPAPVVGAGTAE